MKKLAVLLCLIFTFGCSSVKYDNKISSMPVLLERTELPTIPPDVTSSEFYLTVKMMVNEKGEVAKVVLLNGLGMPEWDSSAVKSIKRWKYEPAKVDGTPINLWLVQKVKVQVETPLYLPLSEIVCDSYDQAEFIMSKLSEGEDFGELALKYSKDTSKSRNGYIGKKDINLYPANISRVLRNLSINQHTKPLQIGKQYVIFKRMRI
ncbi:MAG: TonB family protein [Ignavibacteria bacterium]|nr:TonB family protein [Ignavibacteria bacterium]